MFKNRDYTRILDISDSINRLDLKLRNEIKGYYIKCPQKESIDYQNNQIHVPAFAQLLHQHKLFESFVTTISDNIPLDLYLHLYVYLQDLKSRNYKTVLGKIKGVPIYKLNNNLRNDLEFISLVQVLILRKSSWSKFTRGFEGNEWQEIDLLAEVLPVSNIELDEFIIWISLIVEKQSKDGALNGIAKYIYEWVIRNKSIYTQVDRDLIKLAKNNSLNLFLGPLLRGIKEKQQRDNKYYISRLSNILEEGNAYKLLHSLGTISLDDQNSKDIYYNLLLNNLRNKKLKLSEFIILCNIFFLYQPELFSKIDAIIKVSENVDELRSVIQLINNDKKNEIDPSWKLKTSLFLFAKNLNSLKNDLNYFLISIADNNLNQAYELFEARMKIMAHTNMLKEGVVHMIQKNAQLFQSKLIDWLNQEDTYLHLAVREICSIHGIGKSLFEIPVKLFEEYTNEDKLYIAYKIAGYVYSKDALQRLILSVIESIDEQIEALNTQIYFILTKYLIYNYRGTLELLKKYLVEHNLTAYPKELFEKVIEDFEKYFTRLNNILVDKELRPYKEHLLLKRFYMNKHFSDLPEAARKNSFASFLKNTQINSNKWAIRRLGQIKHEVKDLSHISINSEFPSGEYLNPVSQEYIRRTYQKIKKDEINIY